MEGKKMFDNQNKKTELIIVCDEKLMEYANYLMALIGQNDDVDDEIVGTKDGMVTAAIWTPKNYKGSLATISSNTHILFIGNFKEAKEQGKNIDFKFDKYGMHYGWLGKRAVMYVDDVMMKKEEYGKFFDFSKKYQKKFEMATVNIVNSLPDAAKWFGVLLPVVYPAAIYGLISGSIAHKKIRDQQYRCLTMALYLDDLQKFLEG